MKRIILSLLTIALWTLPTLSQVGTWRAYMSYYEPQQIIKVGHSLFVRASNDLYEYNLNDHSITTYDKVTQLNDTYITHIAWNQQASRLIITYSNSNIDLLDQDRNVTNVSALYNRSMTQDKTINSVYIDGIYAYLATGFGVVKLNMQRAEIADSYILNLNVLYVGINDDRIYALTNDGTVYSALLQKNLLDPHNWAITDGAPDGTFYIDTADWEQYHELVTTLQPGGPMNNQFGYMRFKHNRLYTCDGGYNAYREKGNKAVLQILKDGEWTFIGTDVEQLTGRRFEDMDALDADNNDPDHIYTGGKTGLYEFRDGQLVATYNIDNSPLSSALTDSFGDIRKDYTLVEALCFDHEGHLWCLNSSTHVPQSLFELTPDHEWVDHHQPELFSEGRSLKAMQSLMEDSRGYLWFVNYHWTIPSFYGYDPIGKRLVNKFTSIQNQDGTIYSDYRPQCVAEDMEGNIWIGTSIGPFMIESANIGADDAYATQVKVPRNDGTNYADYLLSGTAIHSIVIDGGGRKWFGTQGNGIYLISADNMTELAHFTTENSPLLSNNIESMTINSETGELFISTDMGLCSYMSDGTTAVSEMEKDNVYAYPNPVVSGYDGLITVVGLSLNADVKILTTSGKLVAQGRSNGGMFTWDGRDQQGRRVASGIYMVAAATHDGKKGTVCKIAIVR